MYQMNCCLCHRDLPPVNRLPDYHPGVVCPACFNFLREMENVMTIKYWRDMDFETDYGSKWPDWIEELTAPVSTNEPYQLEMFA
jgi:recombinational DNA repair protein (RecF pathway)